MGWMGSSIIRYSYVAYDPPTYHGGQSWLQIAPFATFCSAGNDCTPATGCTLGDSECWWHQPVSWIADCASTCATSNYETNASTPMPTYIARYSPTCTANTSILPSSTVIVSVLSNIADNDEGCTGQNWSNGGNFTYSPGTDSSGNPIGDVDTHQLGSGFDGYILFTHTEPASATTLVNTGTWTPKLPSLQYYKVMVHIPASGAAATDIVYTINPGGNASPWKIRVNQDFGSEEWVPIATVAMQNGGSVSLSNVSSMSAGHYDVAFDSVAFVPQGGTPGSPIGGPPTVQDEPAGSNPAMIQCGCAASLAGDPVDTATGAFTQTTTDLSTPGIGEALNLSRTYTSSLANPASSYHVNGAFGPGWTYNYGLSAATNATNGSVTVTQEDGSQVVFTDASGTYTPPARDDVTLTKSGADYYYTRHGGVQYVFDSSTGHLVEESDQAGRAASSAYRTSLAYNTSGQLSTITDPVGRTFTVTWAGSHISKVVDAAAREVDYAYNSAGDLTDVYGVGTSRTGGVNGNQDHTVYGYTTAHLLTSMTTPANEAKSGAPHMSMVYDTSGRVTSQTDPVGATTTFLYGPSSSPALTNGQTLVTDAAGHKVLDSYTNGLLTSKTAGYGAAGASTWSYVYDPISLGVAMQANPDGTTQTFSYDAAGHQIAVSDATGQTTSYQYNQAGQVTASTDPTGLQTFTTYSAAGAPTQVLVSSDGQSAESANDTLNPSYQRQTTSAYANAALPGLATSITDPDGNTTTFSYDSHGQPNSTTDASGNVTKYGYYTPRGLKTSMVSAKGVAAGIAVGCKPPATGCTSFGYDSHDNLASTTDALGNVTSASFDADGHETSSTDANGHTTATGFDGDGRATSVTQASGAVSSTAYNGDGTVAKTIDANGEATGYTYNAQGQELTSTDPDGHTTTITRDLMGRVHTSAAPGGQVTTDEYDGDGRLSRVSYSDSTHDARYSYDANGRLTSMVDGTGTSSDVYDVFGELISQTNGAGATVGYAYDGDGNTTAVSYPGGVGTVTRGFTKLGQLATVTNPGASSATVSFGYDPDGDLTTTTAGNGTTVTQAYDGADRATASTLARGATTLGSIANTRDKDGDLTGTAPSSGAPGAATSYTYTADQRLASSTVSGGTTANGYDKAGDPTTLGGSTQVFDAAGRLCWSVASVVGSPVCGSPVAGATTYAYDANGRRTGSTPASGSVTGYQYNAAGELTGVSGGVSASYTYDGAGLRATKTVGAVTAVFVWDTAGSTPQLLSDGTTDFVYGPAGTPVEQFAASGAGNQQFYFSDPHGSTVALTSSAGVVDGTWAYSPWGAVTAHTGTASTSFLFAGAYRDAETGLLYLQARYYDPATAVFLTVDPLVALTGQAYVYTGDDPLNKTDPTGRSWQAFVAGAASAVFGAVGLGVDSTGIGIPIGLALEGASLAAGALATGMDCGGWFGVEKDSGACGLDVMAESTAGLGAAFDIVNDGLRAVSVAGRAREVARILGAFGASDEEISEAGSATRSALWDSGEGSSSFLEGQAKLWGTASLSPASVGIGSSIWNELSPEQQKHCGGR
ncbi:RHS repeat-associated core domain-containing protein [Propionibacterium cyclohexanicum]|uniref:RHS repeat-associated core domain-containing protein n=2 Tax=Propionibacterium cyclohexanicum TaxID=64702 RepID=A0A1H9U7W6_9ACTN|nr:RHS repeat-associated core domain-containing protein [Propionibacterium cyclohexanicum]